MKIRYLNSAFAVLTILLTSGFAFAPGSGPTPPDPGLKISFTPDFFSCVGCLQCGSGHFTGYWGPLDDYSGDEHGCAAGSCGSHGVCGGEEEEVALVDNLETIRRTLQGSDVSALRGVIAQDPSILLSSSRQAIQVVGCDEAIVAHFPLTESAFFALNQ